MPHAHFSHEQWQQWVIISDKNTEEKTCLNATLTSTNPYELTWD